MGNTCCPCLGGQGGKYKLDTAPLINENDESMPDSWKYADRTRSSSHVYVEFREDDYATPAIYSQPVGQDIRRRYVPPTTEEDEGPPLPSRSYKENPGTADQVGPRPNYARQPLPHEAVGPAPSAVRGRPPMPVPRGPPSGGLIDLGGPPPVPAKKRAPLAIPVEHTADTGEYMEVSYTGDAASRRPAPADPNQGLIYMSSTSTTTTTTVASGSSSSARAPPVPPKAGARPTSNVARLAAGFADIPLMGAPGRVPAKPRSGDIGKGGTLRMSAEGDIMASFQHPLPRQPPQRSHSVASFDEPIMDTPSHVLTNPTKARPKPSMRRKPSRKSYMNVLAEGGSSEA